MDEPLEKFCKRYQLAQKWVTRFNERLANEEESDGGHAAAGAGR